MLKKFLKPMKLPAPADWGVLILRVGFSLLMLTHGYAKLQNLLAGDHSFADPIGIGEELSLYLTIFAEFGCSILLILGLFSRAVLIPLIFTMVVVLLVIHAEDPFDKKEHALSFLIVYVTLFLTGPGRFSVDSGLYK
ncbi:DoxX family protein [Dyadobacter fanqingshengii]|uniref:DoxX family protein n=1 Tax=Dyadobacter fanqingshengii TaxID=2906443 RepID=A0A9X1PEK2_9BACT|nr:DoxX family protein [Dyadobacter fanqingshengii]MCF0043060.1 DoxX family protein [Dyadobacter fanqingshengii]USJ35613.1 DoxX family protein [Dyadobacter fanqingshengii]